MSNDPTNSIVWALKRLFDPPAEVEREERERKADLQEHDRDGGEPPKFRCRVCEYESEGRAFCPSCLADTMERVARPAPTP